MTAVYKIAIQQSRTIIKPDKVVIIYDLSKRITRNDALIVSKHLAMTIAVNAEEDTVLEIPHCTLRRLEDGGGGVSTLWVYISEV